MEQAAPDNRSLIEEILRGSQAAFRTFVSRHQRLVSHIVFRMVANAADREDVCQDVFLKVFHNLGSFRHDARVSTWVARIAYNACIDHLQRRKIPLLEDLAGEDGSSPLETIADPAEGADAAAETRDLFARVQAEMAYLPPQYRAILTLYHLDEMTYEEIVEITGLPMGTVKNYLFRARRQLRDRLLTKYRTEDIWLTGT
ncbi:MAG TPA: sigma-70 family RNA polymerase sigma factor [candidate division Zixibacteria bacterium]|nr:sigma-70 family RNA polymerase sigma factor [candidate division Zixibacteria bacterium]MDD4918623.1 sigma-70 family RNA polymerase sigma factor [candidate division Zixibacteria bacterium]MDM7974347.1 sigma-70 family RNA polymerase sigma factor [candidate division Zixibacteria bacterium]HOD66054.1 sigma-70 family RNA polymerase sigma factor [candidate division Zixibacteria bacterium]HPC11823.1 sigma-70 family RNA polymerase sigma factor [candidate division Zixibacteria bacterium]